MRSGVRRYAFVVGAVLVAVGVVPARATIRPAPGPASQPWQARLWVIEGHVTDPHGVPLARVAISDGNNVVYTDASGGYSLPEDPTAVSVAVSASRLDCQGQTRFVTIVDAEQPVDFVLTPW